MQDWEIRVESCRIIIHHLDGLRLNRVFPPSFSLDSLVWTQLHIALLCYTPPQPSAAHCASWRKRWSLPRPHSSPKSSKTAASPKPGWGHMASVSKCDQKCESLFLYTYARTPICWFICILIDLFVYLFMHIHVCSYACMWLCIMACTVINSINSKYIYTRISWHKKQKHKNSIGESNRPWST